MSTLEHLTASGPTTNEPSNVCITNGLHVSCCYLSHRANPLTHVEPIRMLDVNATTSANNHDVQAVDAEKTAIQIEIIKLIRAWSQPKERYADLRSRARTAAAHQLIARIYDDIEELEQKAGSRVRKRRERSGAKFPDAIERFVGDLLRAKAGTTAPALHLSSHWEIQLHARPCEVRRVHEGA